MTITLKMTKKDVELYNDPKRTIIDLARRQGIFIKASCGEKGTCGHCLVNLIKGHFLIQDKEIIVSESVPRKALSCMTRVLDQNAVIEIPQQSLIEASGRIIDDFILTDYNNDPPTKKYCLHVSPADINNQLPDQQRLKKELLKQRSIENIQVPLPVLQRLPDSLLKGDQTITVTLGRVYDFWLMIDIEPGDTTPVNYGLAVDIGTTTVVGLLIDLTKGEIIDKSSLYNRQITIAEDVISRISLIQSQKELKLLKSLVIDETVNPIIKNLCSKFGIKPKNISRTALSGNTVMLHLLLGLNPQSIGKAPFQPVTRIPGMFPSSDVGLEIAPNGIVDIIPSASGYIGGDIISDIYVSKLYEEDELSALIDIGTNGEIVMCENGKMVACSTAAGPAFEGYGLYHGCRATDGAIERIFFDRNDHLHIEVIGDNKAVGICGTGIVDFIAEGLRIGLLARNGRFNEELLKRLQLYDEIHENGNRIKACIIANREYSAINEPILITEADISKILQAKAAMYAGMKILLEIQNKTWKNIKRLILAGGFAKHLHPDNAVSIGLILPVPEDRIEVIGNGSLAGAFLALIEPNAIDVMTAISSRIDVIELNMYKEFQKYYIDALFLPNRNEDD